MAAIGAPSGIRVVRQEQLRQKRLDAGVTLGSTLDGGIEAWISSWPTGPIGKQ